MKENNASAIKMFWRKSLCYLCMCNIKRQIQINIDDIEIDELNIAVYIHTSINMHIVYIGYCDLLKMKSS